MIYWDCEKKIKTESKSQQGKWFFAPSLPYIKSLYQNILSNFSYWGWWWWGGGSVLGRINTVKTILCFTIHQYWGLSNLKQTTYWTQVQLSWLYPWTLHTPTGSDSQAGALTPGRRSTERLWVVLVLCQEMLQSAINVSKHLCNTSPCLHPSLIPFFFVPASSFAG